MSTELDPENCPHCRAFVERSKPAAPFDYHDDKDPDPLEAAYWRFDSLRAGRGRGVHLEGSPMSERDAFKAGVLEALLAWLDARHTEEAEQRRADYGAGIDTRHSRYSMVADDIRSGAWRKS